MSQSMPCAQCAKVMPGRDDEPDCYQGWCSRACHDAYDAAHPEELKGWIKVEDLNAMQRALLDATLGIHKGNG